MCKSKQWRMYQFSIPWLWLDCNLVVNNLTPKDQLLFNSFDPIKRLYFDKNRNVQNYIEPIWLVKKSLDSRIDKVRERLSHLKNKPITIFTFWYPEKIPHTKNHFHIAFWELISTELSETQVIFTKILQNADLTSKLVLHLLQFEWVIDDKLNI